MARSVTWSNIGTDVKGNQDLNSVLKEAGLDYEVTKSPICIRKGLATVPDKMATVRSDGTIYGVVSSKYQVVQNKEAFDFVNYLSGDVEFVKAGETGSGMVYIIAKMEPRNVLGEVFEPYAVFQNGFNGAYTIRTAITPVRVFCQNQFNLIFRTTPNTINIRHSAQTEWKMKEAQIVLSESVRYMEKMDAFAERAAKVKVPDIMVIADDLFPIKEDVSSRKLLNLEEARNQFLSVYDAEDNQNIKGTAWGVINAYADYATHKPILRATGTAEESKFLSVTLDPKVFMVLQRSLVMHTALDIVG